MSFSEAGIQNYQEFRTDIDTLKTEGKLSQNVGVELPFCAV